MELKTGIRGEQRVRVTEEMTAKRLGSGELPVLATPMMIALMENTAYKSVADCLEEGQGTVGTRISVSHISATPVGMEISLESELIEIDRKRLVFKVRAHDTAGCIGEGEHERFIIDEQKFLEKTKAK